MSALRKLAAQTAIEHPEVEKELKVFRMTLDEMGREEDPDVDLGVHFKVAFWLMTVQIPHMTYVSGRRWVPYSMFKILRDAGYDEEAIHLLQVGKPIWTLLYPELTENPQEWVQGEGGWLGEQDAVKLKPVALFLRKQITTSTSHDQEERDAAAHLLRLLELPGSSGKALFRAIEI